VARIVASAEGTVEAPADTLYRYIADMRDHHPRFLPPGVLGLPGRVRWRGRRHDHAAQADGGRAYPQVPDEDHRARPGPGPDRVRHRLQRGHHLHGLPQGTASLVQISTAWDGAGGIGGLFERMFAPRVLRAIFTDELSRLDAYAREHRSA